MRLKLLNLVSIIKILSWSKIIDGEKESKNEENKTSRKGSIDDKKATKNSNSKKPIVDSHK